MICDGCGCSLLLYNDNFYCSTIYCIVICYYDYQEFLFVEFDNEITKKIYTDNEDYELIMVITNCHNKDILNDFILKFFTNTIYTPIFNIKNTEEDCVNYILKTKENLLLL